MAGVILECTDELLHTLPCQSIIALERFVDGIHRVRHLVQAEEGEKCFACAYEPVLISNWAS